MGSKVQEYFIQVLDWQLLNRLHLSCSIFHDETYLARRLSRATITSQNASLCLSETAKNHANPEDLEYCLRVCPLADAQLPAKAQKDQQYLADCQDYALHVSLLALNGLHEHFLRHRKGRLHSSDC